MTCHKLDKCVSGSAYIFNRTNHPKPDCPFQNRTPGIPLQFANKPSQYVGYPSLKASKFWAVQINVKLI